MIGDIGLIVAIGVAWRMALALPTLPAWGRAGTIIAMVVVVLLGIDIVLAMTVPIE